MTTTTRLSETYRQLFRLFEALEAANYVPGTDFGENLSGCFQWFVAPGAVGYLEKRNYDFWNALKNNQKVIFVLETWQGFKTEAANISLK
jgi:hypothetical protein